MTLKIVHFMRRPSPGAFSIERLFADLRAAAPQDCEISVHTCENPSKGILPRVQDMWRARAHQGDVNHVTGDVHYLTFLMNPARTVLTIHDLVMLRRLRGLKRFILWVFWYWLPIRRVAEVVVISEAIRKELLQSVRCDPEKVRVIHNAVSEEFQPVPFVFNHKRPRILHVGVGWNKNLERVVRSLEGIECKLVVIGRLSEGQLFYLTQSGISFENHYGLSREGIRSVYESCDMLLFASLYEGFGLPIVEAQAIGRPVVTSNIHSMPEVAGEAACLVDPLDTASIRAGVLRVLSDAAYRNDLVARGHKNVLRFSAHRMAERYAAVYRRLAGVAAS